MNTLKLNGSKSSQVFEIVKYLPIKKLKTDWLGQGTEKKIKKHYIVSMSPFKLKISSRFA